LVGKKNYLGIQIKKGTGELSTATFPVTSSEEEGDGTKSIKSKKESRTV